MPAPSRLLALPLLALALGAGARAEAAASGGPAELAALQERIIAVSERVKPWVVHVEAVVRVNDRRSPVTGSGVIASEEGLVLTNHHVVERAEKVEVSVPGRRRPYPARVLGTDKPTDVALLAIEPEAPLPAAEFGSAESVRVGQWVLAVGNPYGLDGTVSFGIVSAKGRNLEIPDGLNDFIQTDAMIDRGSSGGPLVDLGGRVIGINSRGQGRGIGFTIPVETALQVMEQIRAGGVERGWLGISVQPLSRDLAAHFGIPEATGVVVNGVSEGSPAAGAGLAPGDVLTRLGEARLDAEEPEDLGEFQRAVARIAPGETVSLRVLREGSARRVEATLAAQPRVDAEEAVTEVGFHVQEVTERAYRERRLASREGALVSFVARGSPAAEAGLAPGDVVVRVGERPVADLGAFRAAMEAVTGAESFLVHARRGRDLKFLLVKRGGRPEAPGTEAAEPGRAAHAPETR